MFAGNTKNRTSSVSAPAAVVIPVSTVNLMSLATREFVALKALLDPCLKSYAHQSISQNIDQENIDLDTDNVTHDDCDQEIAQCAPS